MPATSSEKPIAVYGAIASNFVIAVTKFAVSFITGSSAMLSEGIHSTVDTGNELLLLLGVHQSKKKADEQHPFGHGMELYFWSLIVAVILFGIGGGMGIYEGITHLEHPGEITDPTWNYVVLGIAFIAEGISWTIALRHLLRRRHNGENFWHLLRNSKDPSVYTVFAEDSAALAGIIVAFFGIFLSHRLNNPHFDGIASIIIGVILILVAAFLVYESRSLIIGESANPDMVKHICEIARNDADVTQVRQPLTMYFGPRQILLNMELEFRADLSASEAVKTVDRLEAQIRAEYPEIKHIYIEANTLKKSHIRS